MTASNHLATSDPDRVARVITGKSDQAVTAPPAELRQGIITAVDAPNARVDVQIGGNSAVIPGVAHLSNYLPAVNDTCWVMVNGPDLVVLDRTATPGPAPRVERWSRNTSQSIPDDTSTKVVWNQQVSDAVDVTHSSGTFTLQRSGLWLIVANVRFLYDIDYGPKFLWISDGASAGNPRLSQAAQDHNGDFGLHCTALASFASGDQTAVWVYQRTNQSLNIVEFADDLNVSLTWLGP